MQGSYAGETVSSASGDDAVGVVSAATGIVVGGDRVTLSLLVGEDSVDVDEECEGVHVISGG